MENTDQVVGTSTSFFAVIIEIFKEIAGFFKYIFNDVWLGIDP